MIGRIVAARNLTISSDDGRFVQACLDVLGARAAFSSTTRAEAQKRREVLLHIIAETCPHTPDWKDALAVVNSWTSAKRADVQTTMAAFELEIGLGASAPASRN